MDRLDIFLPELSGWARTDGPASFLLNHFWNRLLRDTVIFQMIRNLDIIEELNYGFNRFDYPCP